MPTDVVLNKVAIIERCLERVRQEYEGHEQDFGTNLTRQDAAILNLLRACEATIDLAMHQIRVRRLGIPQESRAAFQMLADADWLEQSLADRLKAMVGFRNIAVHNYQTLDLEIVRHIITDRLDDFRHFARLALAEADNGGDARR